MKMRCSRLTVSPRTYAVRIFTFVMLALLASAAVAEEKVKVEPVSPLGRPITDKPGYVVDDKGRVTPHDALGREKPNQQHFQIQGKEIRPVDSAGRVQHNKPYLEVQPDGQIIQKNAYGRREADGKNFVVKDGKVYEADAYGRPRYNKPAYQVTPKK